MGDDSKQDERAPSAPGQDGLLAVPGPSTTPRRSRQSRTPSVLIHRAHSSDNRSGLFGLSSASASASPARSPSPAAHAHGAASGRHRATTVSNPLQPCAGTHPLGDLPEGVVAQQNEAAHATNNATNVEAKDFGTDATGTSRAMGWAEALGLSRGQRTRPRAATTAASTAQGSHGAPLRRRRAGSTASALSNHSIEVAPPQDSRSVYTEQVHDLLDVLDPEVQTLNTLGDVQNSLFIPYTGFFDRTRRVQLTRPPSRAPQPTIEEEAASPRVPSREDAHTPSPEGEKPLPPPGIPPKPEEESGGQVSPVKTTVDTVADKVVLKGEYFVLPTRLVDTTDWTEQEKADLDDYVRHLMHSRKEKLRRTLRGFRKYVSTPLGAFVTIWSFMLTFWGAAWMLFLIGWINAGDRQKYYVEICDQILVALFCLVGLGLIPWRIVDTYHTFYVVKYHRKTLKLRKARGLPKLKDPNDVPNNAPFNHDLEIAGHGQDAVLSDEEQEIFHHHQGALAKSHTYYRPHETITHRAFPISFLIAIITLCDCHSTFQLALGSATWSISYHRNFKSILTTVILCFSLSSNITAGILIAVGNRKTRKVEVVEQLMRQALTQEAIKRKEHAEKYRAEKRAEAERAAIYASRASVDRPHNFGDALAATMEKALLPDSLLDPSHLHQRGKSDLNVRASLDHARKRKDSGKHKDSPARASTDSQTRLIGSSAPPTRHASGLSSVEDQS